MALAVGNLLGAYTSITGAFEEEKTLEAFLHNVNKLGVQTKCNFEVNFSGLQSTTLRVQDLNLPTFKANTTELFYDGHSIPITINYDYEHDFSMTILNDAQGIIYTAVKSFIMSDVVQPMNGGYKMIVKALTGDKKYDGAMITCEGVRLTNLSGLEYGQSAADVQIFTVSGVIQSFTHTPGALSQVAGVVGGLNSLFG